MPIHLRYSPLWLYAFLIFGLACHTGAQQARKPLLPSSVMFKPVEPTSKDITARQADKKARALLSAFGLIAPKTAANSQIDYDAFYVRTLHLYLGTDYEFTFNSETGVFGSFKNLRREQEQIHSLHRNKPFAIQTREQAKQSLWKYAHAVGVPSGAFLTDFRWYGDNDPKYAHANRAGVVAGRFRINPPTAYPMYSGQFPGGTSITVDPLDGQLVELRQAWDYKLVPALVRITKEQAIQQVTSTLQEYFAHHPILGRVSRKNYELSTYGRSGVF